MNVTWIESTETRTWLKRSAAVEPPGESNLALGDETGERWRGFGCCFNELGWLALRDLPAEQRRAVLECLFAPRGCALSIGRIPVGASDYAAEWYSCNEHEGDFAMRRFSVQRDRKCLLEYLKEALAIRPELSFFCSPWSPPTWMKQPRAHNFGRVIMEPEYLDAYALYLLKFVKAYAAEGVHISQVHPQNEPAADQKFPSCLWSGEQLRVFIRDHLGPLFARKAPRTKIWLGTMNTADYAGMFLPVLLDDDARRYVHGIGLQWDGKAVVRRCRRAWPGLEVMQTENECGDGRNTWDYAHYVFSLFQHYMANGASAYVYWNAILPPGGMSTWGWRQNAMITVDPATRDVTFNPEFFVMKHFSHFVQPGAARLELEGPWSGNAVAFKSGRAVTVVIANPMHETHELVLRAGSRIVHATMQPRSFNTLKLAL